MDGLDLFPRATETAHKPVYIIQPGYGKLRDCLRMDRIPGDIQLQMWIAIHLIWETEPGSYQNFGEEGVVVGPERVRSAFS